jgi:hypothetical protein
MTGRCKPVCVEAIERANYATTKNNIHGNVIHIFFDKDVRVAATRVAASIVITDIPQDSQDGIILLCKKHHLVSEKMKIDRSISPSISPRALHRTRQRSPRQTNRRRMILYQCCSTIEPSPPGAALFSPK